MPLPYEAASKLGYRLSWHWKHGPPQARELGNSPCRVVPEHMVVSETGEIRVKVG